MAKKGGFASGLGKVVQGQKTNLKYTKARTKDEAPKLASGGATQGMVGVMRKAEEKPATASSMQYRATPGFTPSQTYGSFSKPSPIARQPQDRNTLRRNAISSKMSDIGGSGSAATGYLATAIAKRKALADARLLASGIPSDGQGTRVQGGGGLVDMSRLQIKGFGNDQIDVARQIYEVGKAKGASNRDIQIALMTAFQESGMRNVNYGDRDSLGVFQQRPSQGWGSPQQVQNVAYAAGKFYDDLLGRVGNKRNNMSLTQAAQAVQRSAYPDHYAKHEGKAAQLLNAFIGASGGSTPSGAQNQAQGARPGVAAAPTSVRQAIMNEAFSMLGIPYAWGGGGIGNRSSRGTGKGTERVIGVDCSGLTSYVYGTIGVKLPRHSTAQYAMGVKTSIKNAKPGDLIGKPGGGHVGIYIGNGQMLHSPRPGATVSIRKVLGNEFAVALRLPGD